MEELADAILAEAFSLEVETRSRRIVVEGLPLNHPWRGALPRALFERLAARWPSSNLRFRETVAQIYSDDPVESLRSYLAEENKGGIGGRSVASYIEGSEEGPLIILVHDIDALMAGRRATRECKEVLATVAQGALMGAHRQVILVSCIATGSKHEKVLALRQYTDAWLVVDTASDVKEVKVKPNLVDLLDNRAEAIDSIEVRANALLQAGRADVNEAEYRAFASAMCDAQHMSYHATFVLRDPGGVAAQCAAAVRLLSLSRVTRQIMKKL